MPTRNIFGWQRPCYLLNEGYVETFKELMESTDWDAYGTGNYEKCANCMAHCGYEPTAASDSAAHPLKAFWSALRGPKTDGPMAPEIELSKQRPADFVFDNIVQRFMKDTHDEKPLASAKAGREKGTSERSNAA